MNTLPRSPRRFRRSRWTWSAGHLAAVAERPLQRLAGLAVLAPERARPLLIPGCRSVHTVGMRFPIDVIFLDHRGEVIRSEQAVGAGRLLFERRATAVLEVPDQVGERRWAPEGER